MRYFARTAIERHKTKTNQHAAFCQARGLVELTEHQAALVDVWDSLPQYDRLRLIVASLSMSFWQSKNVIEALEKLQAQQERDNERRSIL